VRGSNSQSATNEAAALPLSYPARHTRIAAWKRASDGGRSPRCFPPRSVYHPPKAKLGSHVEASASSTAPSRPARTRCVNRMTIISVRPFDPEMGSRNPTARDLSRPVIHWRAAHSFAASCGFFVALPMIGRHQGVACRHDASSFSPFSALSSQCSRRRHGPPRRTPPRWRS
jgi:hypothetical protein